MLIMGNNKKRRRNEMNKDVICNPYLPSYEYVPDGEPHVFGDRLYIFGSHDRFDGKEYCENDYVCWSAPTQNLKQWRYEGIIYKRSQDPACKGEQSHMYAPDVAQGPDGRYYMYYGLDFVNRIAVAVSDTPAGQYEYYGEVVYPDGIRYGGRDKELFRFDPAILADDDGRIWLYTGFSPKEPYFQTVAEKENMTIETMGNCVVELERDMKTIKSDSIPLLPGVDNSKGTGFEGHEFYEASSIRKFNGKYYFIYSSFLSHELAYAVSDRPDGGFVYQGPLHSNGNIGYDGNQEAQFYWGNNHGSVECVNGKYYIFGHRQTNYNECSRQGVAEPLMMDENGKFSMAEMTSSGLNDGPLPCGRSYEAGIACFLQEKDGACKITQGNEEHRRKRLMITQNGPDRESDPCQYVANIKDGSVVGYKYFDMQKVTSITVEIKGSANGQLYVYTDLEKAPVGFFNITPSCEIIKLTMDLNIADGVTPIYFKYSGSGMMDFIRFGI